MSCWYASNSIDACVWIIARACTYTYILFSLGDQRRKKRVANSSPPPHLVTCGTGHGPTHPRGSAPRGAGRLLSTRVRGAAEGRAAGGCPVFGLTPTNPACGRPLSRIQRRAWPANQSTTRYGLLERRPTARPPAGPRRGGGRRSPPGAAPACPLQGCAAPADAWRAASRPPSLTVRAAPSPHAVGPLNVLSAFKPPTHPRWGQH